MPDPALTSIVEARRELGPKLRRGSDTPTLSFYEFEAYRAIRMLAPPRDHHVVTVCLETSPSVRQTRGGVTWSGAALAGRAMVMSAGQESLWDGRIPRHLRIAIPTAMVTEVADASGLRHPDCVSLRDEFDAADPFILEAAALLRAELAMTAHPGQLLVIDSLSTALATHLLHAYGPGSEPLSQPAGRPRRDAIIRALDYIEAYLPGPISLSDLAAAAGLSKYHFARTFREETGMTPVHYVETIRIERAKVLLRRPGVTIAQVATTVGFADQSHFTRRFRYHTGTTPSAFSAACRAR